MEKSSGAEVLMLVVAGSQEFLCGYQEINVLLLKGWKIF